MAYNPLLRIATTYSSNNLTVAPKSMAVQTEMISNTKYGLFFINAFIANTVSD